MQDALPRLPDMGDAAGGGVVAEKGATGEDIIKICEPLQQSSVERYWIDPQIQNGP
jgi:hypothetical protein